MTSNIAIGTFKIRWVRSTCKMKRNKKKTPRNEYEPYSSPNPIFSLCAFNTKFKQKKSHLVPIFGGDHNACYINCVQYAMCLHFLSLFLFLFKLSVLICFFVVIVVCFFFVLYGALALVRIAFINTN